MRWNRSFDADTQRHPERVYARAACQVNGIDGYRHLRALFTALPIVQAADDYAALLPRRIEPTSV